MYTISHSALVLTGLFFRITTYFSLGYSWLGRSPLVNFWEFVVAKLLQTRYPSCHQTNSIKTVNADIVFVITHFMHMIMTDKQYTKQNIKNVSSKNYLTVTVWVWVNKWYELRRLPFTALHTVFLFLRITNHKINTYIIHNMSSSNAVN